MARFESAKDRNDWLEQHPEVEEYIEEVTYEEEDAECPEKTLSYILDSIAYETLPDECVIFLSGKSNFRYDIYDDYKANRRGAIKPKYYNTVRKLLIHKYGAVVVEDIEADDAITIEATKNSDCVIVTEDKDFKQIPNIPIYNPKKQEWNTMEPIDSLRFLYGQMLEGEIGRAHV